MVPDRTLKLDLQPWQFQRPIRSPSAFRPTVTHPQSGQAGVKMPAHALQVLNAGLVVGESLEDFDEVHIVNPLFDRRIVSESHPIVKPLSTYSVLF